MNSQRDRVLSGIQPTMDSFHVGNWFGALTQWVDLQATHDCFYCVVDLHALTVNHDPAAIKQRTLASFAQLIAIGIDPAKSTVFVQSHLAEHSQLAWVLSCITGFGEASRMTQFKDKSQKEGADRSTVGLFTYPILQAADILLYQPKYVPVGDDQRQHLELTRDLAQRFNSTYGQTFTLPETMTVVGNSRVLDLQDPTAKMSKSSPTGAVFIMDSNDQITKKIKSAVTDSDREVTYDPTAKPGIANLVGLLAAATNQGIEATAVSVAGLGYGAFKQQVADALVAAIDPVRTKTQELLSDPAALQQQIEQGATKARAVAAATVGTAYNRLGLLPERA
ncbi:MAG: tryptophan--tRNA ligase [Candidatus Nanopelagicales bacterium]